jgi:hypothetical protein
MSRRDWLVLTATLLLTAALPIWDVVDSGVAGAIRYAAQDAFYYDTVARNITTLGRISFDQVHPTNGFHPLWQALVTFIYAACSWTGLGDRVYLLVTAFASILLVTAAVYVAARTLGASTGRVSLWLLTLPIGAYGFFIAPFWYVAMRRGFVGNSIEGPPQLYGSLFSFMNGMESPLALFVFAVLVERLSRAGPRSAFVDGLTLALLPLARLDTVFISASLLAWLVSGEVKHARRQAARHVLGFVLPIAAYVLFNRVYAGAFLPVSGSTKTSFPKIYSWNMDYVVLEAHGLLADVHAFFRFWRLSQMLVPALFALVAIPLLLRVRIVERRPRITLGEDRQLERVLAASGLGVIALSLYNFCFVHPLNQGHWYYAVSIFWMSLSAVVLLQRISFRWTMPIAPSVGFASIVTVTIFFALGRQLGCHADQASFFARAGAVRSQYPRETKLLEYDDGIVAFATGLPCMNAMGLAVDVEAARAVREGRQGALAYDRGYDRVAVFSYNPLVMSKDSPEQRAGFLDGFIPVLNLGPGFEATLEYALPDTRFAVFRIRRHAP